MSLTLVATPIGNPEDLSLRALRLLREADIIIGEERKVAAAFLRSLEIKAKRLELLNEHSTEEDIKELTELCKEAKAVLISDCGTPGFCDPGALLVQSCRKSGVAIDSAPGASSLMILLSLSSQRLDQFYFRGFLPAENQAREQAWKKLKSETQAIVLMDTPYRLKKFLTELSQHFPNRKVLLGISLSCEDQEIVEAKGSELGNLVRSDKAPFVALLYPAPKTQPAKTDNRFKRNHREGRPKRRGPNFSR